MLKISLLVSVWTIPGRIKLKPQWSFFRSIRHKNPTFRRCRLRHRPSDPNTELFRTGALLGGAAVRRSYRLRRRRRRRRRCLISRYRRHRVTSWTMDGGFRFTSKEMVSICVNLSWPSVLASNRIWRLIWWCIAPSLANRSKLFTVIKFHSRFCYHSSYAIKLLK